MIEIETYKKRMAIAIAGTCIGVIFLKDLIKSSEGFDVLNIVLSVIITVAVSANWIRFILAYVDFSIKEMRHERKMAEIVIQEKIKQLQKE